MKDEDLETMGFTREKEVFGTTFHVPKHRLIAGVEGARGAILGLTALQKFLRCPDEINYNLKAIKNLKKFPGES